jgi:hypothetical protein
MKLLREHSPNQTKDNIPAPAIQQPKKTRVMMELYQLVIQNKQRKDILHRTAGVPMSLLSVLKARAEIIAPAFPEAAEMPCANARNLVGNTTPSLFNTISHYNREDAPSAG